MVQKKFLHVKAKQRLWIPSPNKPRLKYSAQPVIFIQNTFKYFLPQKVNSQKNGTKLYTSLISAEHLKGLSSIFYLIKWM